MQRAQRAHSLAREPGIDEQAGGVGEPEQLDEMKKIAGALLAADKSSVASLREAVTSPGGTTAAALEVLMAKDGLPALMQRAVAAARKRAEELR